MQPKTPSLPKIGVWTECCLCSLLLLLSPLRISSYPSSSTSFMPDPGSSMRGGGGYQSTYSRSEEVQKQCASYLIDLAKDPFSSSPTDAESRKWTISNELTFLNGDWQQEAGTAPLMPFMDVQSNSSSDGSSKKEAAHLASLWITDVDLQNKQSNMVNVSAVFQVAMSSERALSYMGSSLANFQVYQGFSLVGILMEGVYADLAKGERILCMVGSAKLPSRGKNVSVPWDWLESARGGGAFSPPVAEDAKIMAVFRFPKMLSLTSRAVSGRLQSFHAPSNPSYFNPVDVFSQLGPYSSYQFLSGAIVASSCTKPQLQTPQKVYQGSAFCTVIQELLTGQWIDVMPNWNCTLSNETCIKLGPFSKDSASELMDGGFNGSLLLMQDIRCVDYPEADGSSSANVSAVFRAVLPSQNKNLAFERTGLDGLTLSAEGKWNSISGELCMTGCKGLESSDKQQESCDTKISMSVPLILSLKHRSVVDGSISSILKSSPFYPLSFHLDLLLPQLPSDVVANTTYEYTKIVEAGAILERFEPVGFGESIKKSLLKYPSGKGNLMVLFEDLSLHTLAITNPNMKGSNLKQYVEFDIIAIDESVGLNWMQASNFSASTPPTAVDEEVEKVEEQKNYYKVAGQLKIKDNLGNMLLVVSAEGEYDPMVGRMFLVGCRDVNAPWKTFQENAELLQDGMDCSIELRIEYPPTNARWLMNPTVMFTVTSTRTEDDLLFFTEMQLETFPILYKSQREEIVSRKSLEGGLSIITLSLILGCIVAQLIYIKSHADSTPYISLLMLAVQAVGFSIPLITGVEAFFARMTSDAEDMKGSVLTEGKWTRVIGYVVNLLTLAAFLLTVRIVQKVYKSRIRLGTRRPLEPWRVPNDKRVLAICSAVHVFGFVSVLIIHSIRLSQRPISSSTYMDWTGSLHKQYDWERVLREYYGLVQDLFLLPQVVGNHLWVVQGKPLRMLFYVGVTVLRLLPHVYDSLRSPVFNPYFADEFQYANPSSDFYSKAGDIAIPVLAVLLAIVVYIQQRWNGLKWENVLRQGSSKLMRMGSKMYERLPSKTFEAEMVEPVTTSENGHAVVSSEP